MLERVAATLHAQPVLLLFLVIGLGYLIGNIRIRGISLGPVAGVLFVGDSLERDIVPAKALGLATAWIAPAGSMHPAADVVVETLPDLV